MSTIRKTIQNPRIKIPLVHIPNAIFVEIWIVCSPKDVQGNEKALLNVPCNSAGHLDLEISRCSVVPEKKKTRLCAVQKKRREMKRLY